MRPHKATKIARRDTRVSRDEDGHQGTPAAVRWVASMKQALAEGVGQPDDSCRLPAADAGATSGGLLQWLRLKQFQLTGRRGRGLTNGGVQLLTMRKIIRQSVVLPATADVLFAMYLDPARHGAFTGFPVNIREEPGAAFRAFDGQLTGTMLCVVRPHLVVQSWRSTNFADDDPDSTLILLFSADMSNGKHGRIDLVHLDVPEHDYQGVSDGWHKYYWAPWRTYLEQQQG